MAIKKEDLEKGLEALLEGMGREGFFKELEEMTNAEGELTEGQRMLLKVMREGLTEQVDANDKINKIVEKHGGWKYTASLKTSEADAEKFQISLEMEIPDAARDEIKEDDDVKVSDYFTWSSIKDAEFIGVTVGAMIAKKFDSLENGDIVVKDGVDIEEAKRNLVKFWMPIVLDKIKAVVKGKWDIDIL